MNTASKMTDEKLFAEVFPRGVRLASALIAFGFLYCILTVAIFGQDSKFLPYIYFLMPILWMVWLIAVFRVRGSIWPLVTTWVLIDLLILLTLGVHALGVKDFCQSIGADFLMLFIYFPVIVPSSFVLNVIQFNVSSLIGCSGIVGALSIWIEMSLMALPQSAIVILLARKL